MFSSQITIPLLCPLQELEGHWESQQGEEHLLTNQLKRLQDDLRRVNRQLEKGQSEKATLEEKIGMLIFCLW